MILIRLFEERVLELFSLGKLSGTTHTYIGQEANAVGVVSHLHEEDIVFSNHRCHGHYLAKTGDAAGLLSEMMGKEDGLCAGLGGSQHLCNRNFFSNGIQGSYMPIVVGMALAEKLSDAGRVTTAFIGDGTMGEGIVYESFNLTALYQVPLLVVIENNRIAQTTPIALNLAGTIGARSRAFGLATTELDTTDAEEIHGRAGEIIDQLRIDRRPHVLILNTYRLGPHSKGDDTRAAAEIAELRKSDPIPLLADKLDAEFCAQVREEALAIIQQAEEQATRSGIHHLEITA
jgi:TPP-dependent pyruvate/acetoin dehydrogenase alpha subunit